MIDIDQRPNPSEKIFKKNKKPWATTTRAHFCTNHSLLLNVGSRSSFSEVVKDSAYTIHPFFSTFHISILNQVSPFFIIRPAHDTSERVWGRSNTMDMKSQPAPPNVPPFRNEGLVIRPRWERLYI